MMQQTRNLFPLSLSKLRISPATNVGRSTKYYYDKNTKNLQDLRIGDEVYIKRRPDLKDNVEKSQIATKLSFRSNAINENGAAFGRNLEDIMVPATPHNWKFVGEENVMNGSNLDMSNTPIRPNQQPLERHTALPN
jgi:hypothetical protein